MLVGIAGRSRVAVRDAVGGRLRMGQDLRPLTLLQPLQLLYKKICFYFELLFSSEERILLYKKQNKTKFENHPYRITSPIGEVGQMNDISA